MKLLRTGRQQFYSLADLQDLTNKVCSDKHLLLKEWPKALREGDWARVEDALYWSFA